MTSIKKFATALTLGLALALSSAAFAQKTTPNTGDKKESCCAMPSCCCKDDSCPMKDGKDVSCCKGDKSAAGKDGGCCNGDSCNMKDRQAKQARQAKQKQG